MAKLLAVFHIQRDICQIRTKHLLGHKKLSSKSICLNFQDILPIRRCTRSEHDIEGLINVNILNVMQKRMPKFVSDCKSLPYLRLLTGHTNN
ncbi:hypothetical protein DUGA2_12210 [Duganella sp. HH101]|nr:hypothetical protein DUGA2_12210 [Duganella sp. HH101]